MYGRGLSRPVEVSRAGFSSRCDKHGTKAKTAFPTARPVHTVPCMCVPPRPVPWATWHSAELTHGPRVASHRVRAQSTQPSPPAADGDWSTRRALLFWCPQLFTAMLLLLQCNLRTHLIEVRAEIASGSYVQARGVLWSCKKNRWSVAR